MNAGFDVGLTGLGLIRGLVLAALLTSFDYGVWGILTVSLGVLSRIKLVGIGDKYIQQDETDQELAFQKAFTFELLTTGATLLLVLAALPVIVLIYGQERLVPLSLVMSTMLVAGALQTPFWVFYRDMDYVRQRTMLALEPIVGFVVALVLALLGFGYWALALGAVRELGPERSSLSRRPDIHFVGATTGARSSSTRRFRGRSWWQPYAALCLLTAP